MTTPRVEVDLSKIRHNVECLVRRLSLRGISVTGVTKAVRGNPSIARAMLEGGATDLADARVSNVEILRKAGARCAVSLIRTPMLSQVDQVVRSCDFCYNSEIDVIEQIAVAACRAKTIQKIVLIVEMGDLREGLMPEDLGAVAQKVVEMHGVELRGIAANFACLSGVSPDVATMQTFSDLSTETEAVCGPFMEIVSGGNSSNLQWALGPWSTGRVNNLRLGEAILLGRDPISGDQIGGLFTDAFTLVSEVIETKVKTAHSPVALVDPTSRLPRLRPICDPLVRSIISIGKQDTDIDGLTFPPGITCTGATSDHTVVRSTLTPLRLGNEVRLQMNYSALTRIMSAPDTTTVFVGDGNRTRVGSIKRSGPSLQLV